MSKLDILSNSVVPDFLGVKNFEDIQRRFVSAARNIMFGHKLEYGNYSADISSLELYLKLHQQPDIWFDPSTDEGADEQFNRATWYFRKKKGPAYWRIDITAGCRSAGIQAGLLIRAIDRTGGPATALHTIVRGGFSRQWNEDERKRIDEIDGKPIFGSASGPLKLVRREAFSRGAYYIGHRINIPKRHSDVIKEGISMIDAPLRIATIRMHRNDEEHIG